MPGPLILHLTFLYFDTSIIKVADLSGYSGTPILNSFNGNKDSHGPITKSAFCLLLIEAEVLKINQSLTSSVSYSLER